MLGLPLLFFTLRLCHGSSFQEGALLLGLLRCGSGGDDRGCLGLFALEVRLVHHLDLLDHTLVVSTVVVLSRGVVCASVDFNSMRSSSFERIGRRGQWGRGDAESSFGSSVALCSVGCKRNKKGGGKLHLQALQYLIVFHWSRS
ncbi:hypothetical protein EDB83DRAFT_2384514 [Lactarius deliciosus]|nr:hypothetical protein EDB83DRAFT_2384514 [Lactarius deliciosus]